MRRGGEKMRSDYEIELEFWGGFVEWHNKRTINHIDHHSECSCVLRDEWIDYKKSLEVDHEEEDD